MTTLLAATVSAADIFLELLSGFGVSLLIFAATLLFALPLGLVFAFMRMSKFKPLSYLMQGIIWIIRGTPLMLQILIIFYIPGIFGSTIIVDLQNTLFAGAANPSQAVRTFFVIIAFVVNYSAYFAEIYRGGIQSMGVGQAEAASVLGVNKKQTFRYITLPQVTKRIFAPMSNEVITLVKDTSLARVISVVEIIKAAEGIQANTGNIWPLFAAGLFYLVFVGLLTLLFAYAEKKMNYYR